MARALVTGSLGNVGGEVMRECLQRGVAVRGADLDHSAVRQRFPEAEAVRLDFWDRSTWAPALSGCDRLFLLRPPPLSDMQATLMPFASEAYAMGIGHIVFLSVSGADRMRWIPHRKVERHLQALGGSWTVLRPGFFAQNTQDAYRRDILEDDRILVPAGQGRVAFVDVRDVGAVAARILEAPEAFRGQCLTLTGPEALSFEQVAQTLTAALQRRIRYEASTIPAYVWHLRARRGMPWLQALIQTILHVGLRRGDAEGVVSTVQRVLGRPPRTFQEYVQDHASSWCPESRQTAGLQLNSR